MVMSRVRSPWYTATGSMSSRACWRTVRLMLVGPQTGAGSARANTKSAQQFAPCFPPTTLLTTNPDPPCGVVDGPLNDAPDTRSTLHDPRGTLFATSYICPFSWWLTTMGVFLCDVNPNVERDDGSIDLQCRCDWLCHPRNALCARARSEISPPPRVADCYAHHSPLLRTHQIHTICLTTLRLCAACLQRSISRGRVQLTPAPPANKTIVSYPIPSDRGLE